MKVAIVGRTEMLYETAVRLSSEGHRIEAIITSRAAPEYQVDEDDFRGLSEQLGCSFFYETTLGKQRLLDHFMSNKVDLGISVNFVNVIPQDFINVFRLGILNAHTGDLPRYRGNACPNWAIINGESSIALTIHYMVGGLLDAGDIVAQETFAIDEYTYISDVYKWLRHITPKLFSEAVKKLDADPTYLLGKQSENPKDALRCYPRIPSDSEIDWGKSAEEIHRLIRASGEPFSGAYTSYRGKRMTIWRAELFKDMENYLAVPGQVAAIDHENNVIAITGNGKIKITCVSCDEMTKVKPGVIVRSIRSRLGQ